jgi:hypothetical protein
MRVCPFDGDQVRAVGLSVRGRQLVVHDGRLGGAVEVDADLLPPHTVVLARNPLADGGHEFC